MKIKTNKIICFLMVIVMLFTMLPTSIFAATPVSDQNGAGDYKDQNEGTASKTGWSYVPDYGGMRLSLYWSPTKDGFDTADSKAIYQIGQTIDIAQTSYGNYKPTMSSNMSVYEMMKNNQENMSAAGFGPVEYDAYTSSDYSIISKMPMLTQRAYSESELDAFFLGSDTDNPTYENTIEIIKMITAGTGILITSEDFDTGRYTDAYDQIQYGVFKLFYEPVSYIRVDSVNYAMTLRDAIAYSKVKSGFASYFHSAIAYLANAVYLVDDEPAIGMSANSTGKIYKGWSDTTAGLEKGQPLYDSMGVGVVTGGLRDIPGPEVVKTYVTVESVDADGTVHYKKAAETTMELAEFNIDDMGNITQIPIVEEIEGAEGGVAVLNDIVSVDEDMEISGASQWVNTKLPTDVGVELKASAEDIAGYQLGIITGSSFFIDTYTEVVELEEPAASAYKALLEVYEKLEEERAGYAAERTNIVASFLKSRASTTTWIKNVQAIEYEDFEDIKLGHIIDGKVEKIVETSDMGIIGVSTPANNLILRYILKPAPSQINVIEVIDEGKGTTEYINGGRQELDIVGDTVFVQKPEVERLESFGEPILQEWVTNHEIPLKDISNGILPTMSPNGLKGTESLITAYPLDPIIHNLYVKWQIVIPAPERTPGEYHVPEWRLSRLFAEDKIPNGPAMMSLPVRYGCCGLAKLTPSGNWNYTTRNPNGLVTLPGHLPSNLKLKTWLHSETVNIGSRASIGAYNPTAIVTLDGRMNAIKSTDTSGLKVVSWLDKGSISGLTAYDVQSSTKGNPFNKSNYQMNSLLPFNTLNLDTYTNTWPSRHSHKNGGHCHRWVNSKTISPLGAAYVPYLFDATIDFDRYNAKPSSKLVVEPKIVVENGKTTIAYQADTELKIYPEIAMLFDNDAGDSSIKWAVGDQVRTISPVMFHSMQFKVFVDETSNGSSVATDSRGITKAKSMGLANYQIIYKGAGVNTVFKVQRSEDEKDKMGILTVKTFGLDITTNKNGVNLKDAWGAGSYKPADYHNKFLTLWNDFKGLSSERLEIEASKVFTGANKQQNFALSVIKYGGKTVTEFTHELIVRGGSIVGVKLQDRNSGAYSVVKIEDLEAKDAGLYEALENMKLIGENKDETLFKVFEHQTGAKLTEDKYLTMATQAKQSLDGLTTNNLEMNKGWYSEDTTVLVIREYVTNYNVPSVSYSDKIPMTIPGLETPSNKAQFFSVMGKGHTYLKYNIDSIELFSLDSELKEKTKVFFEHNSRTGSPFGKKNVDYLVPNVSITDTTRMH